MSHSAWQLFAVMDDDGTCIKVVAKNPDRLQVIDVTSDIAMLIAEFFKSHESATSVPAPE